MRDGGGENSAIHPKSLRVRLPNLFFTAVPTRDRTKGPIDWTITMWRPWTLTFRRKRRRDELKQWRGEANKHILFCLDILLRN